MSGRALFLHLTDMHLSSEGTAFARDDGKTTIPGIPPTTREPAFQLMLRRLGERLANEGRTLDGVLFSGDAQDRGRAGGHQIVLDAILAHLGAVGVIPGRIVAVPGNHDVPRDSGPGAHARYQGFVDVWKAAGCIVPWLDGIDAGPPAADRHALVAEDGTWAVFAINTSNWSHVVSELEEPLKGVWNLLPGAVANGDVALRDSIAAQLQDLLRFDMARVSPEQLEALRGVVRATRSSAGQRQFRVAVMHHHLRSPSLREEVKAFADITNLEQLRAFMRDSALDLMLHGHKHEHAAYFDHIPSADGEDTHRTLVVSGATFDAGREGDAARLVGITGLPHVPEVTVEPLALPRSGSDPLRHRPIRKRLWAVRGHPRDPIVASPDSPTLIHGTDLDEVYARVLAAAEEEARRGTLIASLDLPDDGGDLPLPSTYELPDGLVGEDRAAWVRELVGWWQLDRSRLEHRIPHLHGVRLRRYGGSIDQIARIRSLLQAKASTRAIAILVDPLRDFDAEGRNEEFASFCLAEFRRRDTGPGRTVIDVMGFYRAQEMKRWWPINVAELRFLQRDVCSGSKFKPGRIVTVAADARTISRSPTQVSMPTIDRWLDQAPEKLHLLAEAFVQDDTPRERHAPVVADWRRILLELRAAVDAPNDDGVPVAIDGLMMFSAYVQASTGPGSSNLSRMAGDLASLARHNALYAKSRREQANYDQWALIAKDLIERLEAATIERFPPGTAPS